MKQFGLTLKECKEIITAILDKKYTKEQQEELITKKIEEIDEKIAKLAQLKTMFLNHMNYDCEYGQ